MRSVGVSVSQTDRMGVTAEQFDLSIDEVLAAPRLAGTIELVVARPATGERLILGEAELVPGRGLVGDNYVERGDGKTPDGRADPLSELNIMSVRALRAVAGPDPEQWQRAGDQLIVDLDLSVDNLPAGTRLQVGTAVIEVTTKPHNGCAKFSQRFGVDAVRWVNSRKDLRLRGLCAVVVEPGTVTPGAPIAKLAPP